MIRISMPLAVALALATPVAAADPRPAKPVPAVDGDPAKVAPDVYKLVMENDRVRVFDVTFKPGQRAEMHAHPDHVVYVLDDATIELTGPDGKSQQVSLKAGQVIFLKAGSHAAENVGKKPAHNLVVELKAKP